MPNQRRYSVSQFGAATAVLVARRGLDARLPNWLFLFPINRITYRVEDFGCRESQPPGLRLHRVSHDREDLLGVLGRGKLSRSLGQAQEGGRSNGVLRFSVPGRNDGRKKDLFQCRFLTDANDIL